MIYSLVYGIAGSPYNVRGLQITSAGLIVTSQYGVALYTMTVNGFAFASSAQPAGAVISPAVIKDNGGGNLDIAFCDTNNNTIYYATCQNGILKLASNSLSGFWLAPLLLGVYQGNLVLSAYFSGADQRLCVVPFYTATQPIPRSGNIYGLGYPLDGTSVIQGAYLYAAGGSINLNSYPSLGSIGVAPSWLITTPTQQLTVINNAVFGASGFPDLERCAWVGAEFYPPKPVNVINNGGYFAGYKHRGVRCYGSGGYVYDLDAMALIGDFSLPTSASNNFTAAWLENCYVSAVGGNKLITYFAGDYQPPSININAELQRTQGPVPLTRLVNLSKVYPFFGRK